MPHTHKCYFHKESTITHFCTQKQCTLPMCQECLPIHLQEHDETCSADASETVVSYGQAQQNAIFGLSSLIGIGKNLRAQCLTKVEQIKVGILQAVDIYLESVKNRICSQFGELTELQKKLAKIQKGSLKTLIYFYSEQSKQFDKSLFSQIADQLTSIQNSVKLSLKQPSKYPHQQNLPQTLNFNYPQQTCPPQSKQRIVSMDVQGNQELVRKSNTKSSVSLLNVESNMRQQRSVTYHQEIKRETLYKDTWKNEEKRDDDRRSADLRRTEVNDLGKQGQIQRIRAKEQERKREKQMKQFALIEEQRNDRQKQRQRDRSIQRSIQRHAEFQKHKAIPTNIENQRPHTYTDNTHQTSYNFPELNRNQTRKYPTLLQDPNRAEYPLMEDTSRRRPLQIADLNVQGRTSLSRLSGKGSASKGVVRSYTFNKQNQVRTSLCDNLFEMNNQVLSPEEIRNMLEKRIQQRSRLISKNKANNHTPPKHLETSPHRGYSRNKELFGNEVVESQRKWDTKDSIINQIYQDYRY